MEHHHVSDAGDGESEEFSERFLCCVCLDLLYKPIVLSCGHIACFWCGHRSMSSEQKSHCPLCRHSYHHFPSICLLLHCLLLKLYPLAYNRRESQTLEQEEKTGYFSPQLDVQAWSSQANLDLRGDSVSKELNANMEETVSDSCYQKNGMVISRADACGDDEGMENATVKNSDQQSGSSKHISVADVPCAACKELLFRPVVLNCGHVYCESCVINQDEQKLRCQVCPSFHPTVYPKVCLDLQNFLVEQFPEELAHRRGDVQLKHVNTTTCESKSSEETEMPSLWSYHFGVGCDYCGMCPIVGDRYKCKDCVEKIGFDLCTDCYNTNSKLPGRFNQQHTADHQFDLMSCNMFRGRVRMLSEQLDGSFAVLLAHMSEIAQEGERNRELSVAMNVSSEIDYDDRDDSESGSI
ncbi:E3 ubiquitin-protein ligase PRT1 [Argentina anserina]|uniref:E3 ubiquitin-protein ligase PRT1 n=1 Tax=Argentina anserina TaxID=57926 RepID=UPI0021768C10|nr:E3 ubiquitin-protein ligase PRT1 [Potentilla anserina]